MTEYLSVRAAAEIHSVTPRRIQRLAEQERIPGASKVSGVWLIPHGFTVLPPMHRRRKMSKIHI